jgi:presqualene diphosphate synthase
MGAMAGKPGDTAMYSESLHPDEAVAAQPVAAGSSFYVAMRVLPARQREAMFDIYAFCRAVDDIADGDAPAPVRRAALACWRRAIDACYDGCPPPDLAALGRHIGAFDLSREDFQCVIDGMLMDADGEGICAPDAATLDVYCDRVASAVGRLSVRVFGMPRGDGVELAHHLGRALQFTNILRDIDEDAACGRVYLPREALQDAGVALGTAGEIVAHPALAGACAHVAAMALRYFRAADAILVRSPSRAARAPRIMHEAYHALLARLVQRGWDRPRQPVRVPRLRRVGIFLRHAFL